MKGYHLHIFLSLANLNIQKSLKHSNTRHGKSCTRAPCSVHTQRATSHRQHHRTKLSFMSSCTRTNKYKSHFKHAIRKRCERVQVSTRSWCSVRIGMCFKALEHRICLFYKMLCQNTRLVEYPRKNYVLSESKVKCVSL